MQVEENCAILPGALRAPAFRCFLAASYLDPFTVHQCIGDLAPGFVQVPPCSLTGDAEFFCCLFLLKPFEINKADKLDFIGQ
jgi:hypothetical protein